MIFNYITFENYRPYYGTQKLELRKKKEDFSAYNQNITLVGGLNGAGKTSLINAFFICFYGRRKFSKDEYEIIKNEAINRRYYREGGRESKIELSFTDRTGTYVIEITFKQDQKNEITETRRIFVATGDELREVTTAEEEFNEFIDQRIPIDVAPFFIFDAEKIRDLVGEHDTKETIKAIQKIVSLELYNQLYEDLFRIRNQDEAALAKTVKDEDLQKLSDELQKCATDLELLKSEERPDEKKIEFLNEDKNYLNQKRRLKLANSSVTKGQINRKIGELENELKLIFTTLERFGRNSLPNLIAAPVVRQLQQRIKKEQNYINSMNKSAAMYAPYDRFISQILNVEVNPPLNNEQKEQLKEKGKSVWAKVNQVQEVKVEPINVLHVNDLSQNELQMILNSSLSSNVDVKGLVSKRIKIQGELQ